MQCYEGKGSRTVPENDSQPQPVDSGGTLDSILRPDGAYENEDAWRRSPLQLSMCERSALLRTASLTIPFTAKDW